ncbi:MAG: hypothetical protein IKP21_07355 [Bacteroidales bacterium]|nr:hypothetical protein [Bacteroidales bacterium]
MKRIAIIAVMATMLLAACGENTKLKIEYDHPERYSVGDVTVEQPVGKIDVDWYNGTVTIRHADRDGLRVYEECDTVLSDSLRMRYRLSDDGTLDIRFCQSGSYRHGQLKRLNKRLIVEVPHGQTLAGIEIDMVGGVVRIDSVVSRELSIDAVNVTVEAQYTTLPDEIEVDGVNTKVLLLVPVTAGLTVDMDAVNTELNCELPVRKEDKKTIIGDGRCKVDVDAVNGSVNIKEL